MIFDKDDVKKRLSLRAVFESDGHVLKGSVAADDLVCRCPFHEEKTASCHVHDKKGFFKCFGCGKAGDVFAYWMETRGLVFQEKCANCGGAGRVVGVDCPYCTGCGQTGALPDLARRAGVLPGQWTPSKLVPVAKVNPEEELAAELTPDRRESWVLFCQGLWEQEPEMERIAEWRGYRRETVEWAVFHHKMAMLPFYGVFREAFLIERPVEAGLLPVGWHVRLAPRTQGNESDKASWRYSWAGIGSWPFVCGDVAGASVIFCLEGQWDALALIDLMGWVSRDAEGAFKRWPKSVAVVGMRGSTSWKRFLRYYQMRTDATVFAIADRDNAGKEWFAKGGFVDEIASRVLRVWGFWPAAAGAKDFNDLVKKKLVTGEWMRVLLMPKMARKAEAKKQTFLAWCRVQTKGRADEIGKAAFLVVRDKDRPKGRKAWAVWDRHWRRLVEGGEMGGADLPCLKAAWDEWMKA